LGELTLQDLFIQIGIHSKKSAFIFVSQRIFQRTVLTPLFKLLQSQKPFVQWLLKVLHATINANKEAFFHCTIKTGMKNNGKTL